MLKLDINELKIELGCDSDGIIMIFMALAWHSWQWHDIHGTGMTFMALHDITLKTWQLETFCGLTLWWSSRSQAEKQFLDLRSTAKIVFYQFLVSTKVRPGPTWKNFCHSSLVSRPQTTSSSREQFDLGGGKQVTENYPLHCIFSKVRKKVKPSRG